MAGNRTRVNCLEGSYAHHYTTNAWLKDSVEDRDFNGEDTASKRANPQNKMIENFKCHTPARLS